MLVERVPVSRPNSPEEPADSHPPHEPINYISQTPDGPSSVSYSMASHDGLHYAPTAHSVYVRSAQHYAVPEMKPPVPSGAQHAAPAHAGYPQSAVRLYESHAAHLSAQRHPIPAMYPTPPLPSPGMARMVEQYLGSGSNPYGMHVVQQVPDIKPLTVYTERQACTALSPPTDLSKYHEYGGRNPFKGLLMTVDGSIGGRSSPAPGTEAVMAGGVGQRLPGQARTRKRSYNDDEASSSCSSSKKGRFTFTNQMLDVLEERFSVGRYIAADERKVLAEKLCISDVQVKNWFQNRRMKWKRQNGGQHAQTMRLQLPPHFPQLKRVTQQAPHQTQVKTEATTSGQLIQLGNTAKLCPAPRHTTYIAPSGASQRKSPMKLVSNAGLPAFRDLHPHMLKQYNSPAFLFNPAVPFPAGVARYVDVKCESTDDGE
ncbi:uncharacterized protein [Amphiura filiformis]|uniref:uncharacterized protein n=1 Tax=Amphiura filiformis TaxID=82378 RepID=UPI003B21C698